MLKPNLYTKFQTVSRQNAEYFMGYAQDVTTQNLDFDIVTGSPAWIETAYQMQPIKYIERAEILASQYVTQDSKDYKYLSYAIWGLGVVMDAYDKCGKVSHSPLVRDLLSWLDGVASRLNQLMKSSSLKVRNYWGMSPNKIVNRIRYEFSDTPFEGYSLTGRKSDLSFVMWANRLFRESTEESGRLTQVARELAKDLNSLLNLDEETAHSLATCDPSRIQSALSQFSKEANKVVKRVNNLADTANKAVASTLTDLRNKYLEHFEDFIDSVIPRSTIRLMTC